MLNRALYGRMADRRRTIAMRSCALLFLTLVLAGGLYSSNARADILDSVQALRLGGCGGIKPRAPALRVNGALADAARRLAHGDSLQTALEGSGYQAQSASMLHVSGAGLPVEQAMRRSGCAALGDPKMRDVGIYQQGMESWLVLAIPYVLPPRASAPMLASRALELVNAARAHGATCGRRAFGPAPPVRMSGTLEYVALGHAADMAANGYFEHEDLVGRTPADRVRAAGYREQLVGENIAYGPTSADEVVAGWLESPGHCENIMDPRFAEMGISYAPGRGGKRGLYWVQLLAVPRV